MRYSIYLLILISLLAGGLGIRFVILRIEQQHVKAQLKQLEVRQSRSQNSSASVPNTWEWGHTDEGTARGLQGVEIEDSKLPKDGPAGFEVRGALDKDLIRGVIRSQLKRAMVCYKSEDTREPCHVGEVLVQFTIGATGHVIASVVQRSTMGLPSLEQCLASTVRHWKFPKPSGGGTVVVTWPFISRSTCE